MLTRLRASERLREHVAALTRNHLRLGFLVHEMPLGRRAIYRYLRDVRAGPGRRDAPQRRRPAGHAGTRRRRRDRPPPGAGARAAGGGAGVAGRPSAATDARRRARASGGPAARPRARAGPRGARGGELRRRDRLARAGDRSRTGDPCADRGCERRRRRGERWWRRGGRWWRRGAVRASGPGAGSAGEDRLRAGRFSRDRGGGAGFEPKPSAPIPDPRTCIESLQKAMRCEFLATFPGLVGALGHRNRRVR